MSFTRRGLFGLIPAPFAGGLSLLEQPKPSGLTPEQLAEGRRLVQNRIDALQEWDTAATAFYTACDEGSPQSVWHPLQDEMNDACGPFFDLCRELKAFVARVSGLKPSPALDTPVSISENYPGAGVVIGDDLWVVYHDINAISGDHPVCIEMARIPLKAIVGLG